MEAVEPAPVITLVQSAPTPAAQTAGAQTEEEAIAQARRQAAEELAAFQADQTAFSDMLTAMNEEVGTALNAPGQTSVQAAAAASAVIDRYHPRIEAFAETASAFVLAQSGTPPGGTAPSRAAQQAADALAANVRGIETVVRGSVRDMAAARAQMDVAVPGASQ